MCAHLWNARCRRLLVGRFIAGGAAMICVNSGHMTPAGPKDGGPVRFRSGNSAGSGARRSQQRREGPEEAAGTRVIGNSPGPLRAVTGGVVPLPLGGPRRLTRCRHLPCLLAGQTALAPSADPPGEPGLHHAHLPFFMEEPWRARLAASLLRLRIPVLCCPPMSVRRHSPGFERTPAQRSRHYRQRRTAHQ